MKHGVTGVTCKGWCSEPEHGARAELLEQARGITRAVIGPRGGEVGDMRHAQDRGRIADVVLRLIDRVALGRVQRRYAWERPERGEIDTLGLSAQNLPGQALDYRYCAGAGKATELRRF